MNKQILNFECRRYFIIASGKETLASITELAVKECHAKTQLTFEWDAKSHIVGWWPSFRQDCVQLKQRRVISGLDLRKQSLSYSKLFSYALTSSYGVKPSIPF